MCGSASAVTGTWVAPAGASLPVPVTPQPPGIPPPPSLNGGFLGALQVTSVCAGTALFPGDRGLETAPVHSKSWKPPCHVGSIGGYSFKSLPKKYLSSCEEFFENSDATMSMLRG